jgi:hypothetical protein
MNLKNILLIALIFAALEAFAGNQEEFVQNPADSISTNPDSMTAKENVWVFILAGQSNMAGRGLVEAEDTIPNERVYTINNAGEIIPAREPLHWYEPLLTGLDCGLSFGKTLAPHLPDSVTILILPTAVGGSSISQWIGDSTYRNVKLLSNFNEKIALGKAHGTIKGILWHQGESDSGSDELIDLYQERIKTLFLKFRTEIGNDSLPILIGELGSYSANDANWQAVNGQIKAYVDSDPYASLIKTSDLTHKGDFIHFDSEGQRTMGHRFALKFLEIGEVVQ